MAEVSPLGQYFEDIAARLERRIDQRAPQNVAPKRLFTVPEAAEYLGRSENAIKLLIHRGKLPVTRIDSKSQIDKKALDKLTVFRAICVPSWLTSRPAALSAS
jgi:excisionase family DNA binding protein